MGLHGTTSPPHSGNPPIDGCRPILSLDTGNCCPAPNFAHDHGWYDINTEGRKSVKRISTLLALALMAGITQVAVAQTEPVQLAAATAQAKQTLGLIVYPAGGQTREQQARDEQACYGWAQQQINPMASGPSADSAAKAGRAKADSATQGAGIKGAVGGAAGGALVGGIAGDAGKGAAMGAIGGALRARRAKREAEQQAEQQARAQAQAQGSQQASTFKKAMVACLQGRGYTVQ